MRLTTVAPFDTPQHRQVQWPAGRTLGEVCGDHAQHVTGCQVNGAFVDAWQDYVPQDSDSVTLFGSTRYGIDWVAWAIVTVVSIAINIGINYLVKALTPTPSNAAGKTEQVFGVAGLTNTTALGTPKFLVYGTRRIFGHIISTATSLSADGKTTSFSILYFMGEGPINDIRDIEINETPIAQFPGVGYEVRLGNDNLPPLVAFQSISQVWADGRALPVGDPIVYTSRSDILTKITVFLQTPFLFRADDNGARHSATHQMRIEWKTFAEATYTGLAEFNWTDKAEATRFRPFVIDGLGADQYQIRVTTISTNNQSAQPPILFNVQEESPGDLSYAGNALLAITGIASSQITSFEAMRASGLEEGRIIKHPVVIDGAWDGTSYEETFSANRAWVVRDVMTNQRVGMGHRYAESLFDDAAAVPEAAYYDEIVHGRTRDECNLLINDRRPAWDWIKTILSEGLAALVLSNGKFKLIVEKAGDPGLLYSMPGNIVEGTLRQTQGSGQGLLPNTVIGQFPDRDAHYTLQPFEVVADGAAEEQRRETLVTIYSLTDTARVSWLLRHHILRAREVQRHFTWQSPSTALVSEPYDIASIAYDTSDFVRGVSGFCPAGSTTGRLILDRMVTLGAGNTYALIVRHQADNSREDSVVATAAGIWGAITPVTTFTTAPAEGDLWALGVQDTAIKTVMIEQVSMGSDGLYQVTASEYVPLLYEIPDEPPPESPSAGLPVPPGVPTGSLKPLPLWVVNLTEQVVMQVDGTMQSMLVFDVTPGRQFAAGFVTGATSTTITLAYTPIDDYFNGAYVTITEGTGVGQTRLVTDYDGASNVATITPPWDVIPDTSSLFNADLGPHDEFAGFIIETRESAGDDFTFYENVIGTQLVRPAEAGPYTIEARFTPVGVSGVTNEIARWTMSITIQGDQEPPGPPQEADAEEVA